MVCAMIKRKSGIPVSDLLILAFLLCGLVLSCANAQQPAHEIGQSSAVGSVSSVPIDVAKSNPLQPLLLELTETVSAQKVKPGDTVHFRVIENFVEDGLTIIAKGTTVIAEAERLDKHAGPAKTPILLLRFGTVKTVTGGELPTASVSENQSSELGKLAMPDEDWPGFRSYFGSSVHYARPGMRQVVHLALPAKLDHERYLAAQPAPEPPPGYATVYFLKSEFHVWCGAVEIGDRFRRVLLRPGSYSCRVERFSPKESYLDFDVADGRTYYLAGDRDSLALLSSTSAEVVDTWNNSWYAASIGDQRADLTKVDPEMFRKLPPLVCAEPRECGSKLRITESFVGAAWFLDRGTQSPTPGSAAQTTTSNSPQTKQVVLELTGKVSSRDAKVGDEVHFSVLEDVIEDSLVVIAKGTMITGKVERVDRRGGWMKDGGLILQTGPVKTVSGEELPVASMLGQKAGSKDVKGGLALSVEMAPPTPLVLPFLPFMKGSDYELQSGTRVTAEVTLPSQLDRARYLAAQPQPEAPPGYATVYFLQPAPAYFPHALFDVWCGAVEIGGLGRTLWRPGKYSCRVEAFSPKESYVDFTFSDGGTYYLVLQCKDPCAGPEDVRPSIQLYWARFLLGLAESRANRTLSNYPGRESGNVASTKINWTVTSFGD